MREDMTRAFFVFDLVVLAMDNKYTVWDGQN
jgi:hypothetical protein